MTRWLSLYWAWLLPALTLLPALARLRALQTARRRQLITRRGWRWMLLALAAAQSLVWLAWLGLVYQTNPWLPISGLAAIAIMLIGLRAARPEVHPGLRGFQRRIPRDGLALIESGPGRDRAWLFALPVVALIALTASVHSQRWLDFVLLTLIVAAPLSLIPFQRQWLSPIFLALPLLALIGQAAALRPALPPGQWAAPITGAQCAGQIRAAPPRAWCVNAYTGMVYQFDLQTGIVTLEARVPEAVRPFAANASRLWTQQNPARGLVAVSAGAVETVKVLSAHSGVADPEGRLWVIDVGQELTVYTGEGGRGLRAADGLLNNTANVVKVSPRGDVWVGSVGGVSWLGAGESEWRTLDQEAGVPGAAINFAFAPDGSVWLLWQARNSRSNWGVMALSPDGSLRGNEPLGLLTGLELPMNEDALAVDGRGRLWLATQSIPKREKVLVVAPPQTGAPAVYSLGLFSTTGPYRYGGGLWEDSFGVVSDGAGGIILFNGDKAPWRHWMP